MPLYEYKCSRCGHVFSKLVRSTGDEKDLKCPLCEETKVDRQISSIASCGSGSSCGGGGSFGGYTRRFG